MAITSRSSKPQTGSGRDLRCTALQKSSGALFEDETYELSSIDLTAEELGTTRDDGRAIRDMIFPNFRETPPKLRYWVWLCTKQSPEWGDSRCSCRTGESHVCGGSGSRKGGLPEAAISWGQDPTIFDTHRYFKSWVADQAV